MGFIIGENIRRIHAERMDFKGGQLEIKITPKLTGAEKEDTKAGKSAIRYGFNFIVDYGANNGKIEIDGDVIYLDTEDACKALTDEWKKDKNIKNEQLRIAVMNRVLEAGYKQAIIQAENVKLPMPLQMPRFVSKEQKESIDKSSSKAQEKK